MTKEGKRQKLTEKALDRSAFYQSIDATFHDPSANDNIPTTESLLAQSNSFQSNRKRNQQKKKQKDPLDNSATEPSLLPATANCQYCNAKRFCLEPPGFCCASGEIQLIATEMLRKLMLLYLDNTEDAIEFRRCVRSYNNVFAFTSIGVHTDQSLGKAYKGIYIFRIQGQMYHYINQLIPADGEQPKNLQLYFFDTDHQIKNAQLIIWDEATMAKRKSIEK
nr:uncharacterized protein LOC113713970 [Coffea arabica]